jgi:carbon storage regulator CsrA
MLMLSRKIGETLHVGEASIKLVSQRGPLIRIAIDAPRHVLVRRDELPERLDCQPRLVSPQEQLSGKICEALHAVGLERLAEAKTALVEALEMAEGLLEEGGDE